MIEKNSGMRECCFRNAVHTRRMSTILLTILFCMCTYEMRAEKTEADDLIKKFIRSDYSLDEANRFFEFLDKEKFTDTKMVFTTGTSNDSLRRQVWYWAAEWYNDVQEYTKAKEYAQKALPLFRYPNLEKADCLNLLGIINVRLGDFPAAASYAKQSVDIDMKLGDPDRISSGLNTLAGIYMAANQAEKAKQFILQGLQYAEEADNKPRKAILLGMASEVYHKLGDDNKSLSYARKAFELDSIQGKKPKMATRLSQIASALVGLKRYKKAESTYIRAIAMFKEVGNLHSVGIDLNQLGFVYINQKRHRKAIECFSEASKIFSKMGDLYNNIYSHKGLYESYWLQNPDSAKIALEKFNVLKDSLYHKASADALAKYNAEFDRDRFQEEIQRRKVTHVRDITLVVGFFLIIAGIAAFVFRAMYRRHQLQMLELIKNVEEIQAKCEKAEKELIVRKSEATTAGPVPEIKNEDAQVFLAQLFETVEAALTNKDYGVAKIASMMNMTERTFSRRMKEITNQSPKMFISAIQMERCAKLLMENPTRTIAEIANLCGFDEASGFSHAFKRIYGCSPTAYREQHRL